MSLAAETPAGEAAAPPIEILAPARQTAPVVFASPHSGAAYPDAFVAAARLTPPLLRRSEDSFVDEIFAAAPGAGAPLLRALFPRAFVDPNREPYELDPAMFTEPLPAWVNSRSPRVRGGLGTIARVVTNGAEIYRAKLSFAEAERRIAAYYRPYHDALGGLVAATRERFGRCLLIDCHSMPSVGGPMDADPGRSRVDFVLGDRYGTSCAGAVTDRVEGVLTELGYRVERNVPYAGGFTTAHYGKPRTGVHTLQIEVNRRLYMDEEQIVRLPRMAVLRRNVDRVVAALTAIAAAELTP
ncbi:MAG: N-formylglutamate amidohydrolase [Alphaproteobacteria bacterium]|nr:N-formylglutamate amidohydrolase [Alphaproteobacteria bacterium]